MGIDTSKHGYFIAGTDTGVGKTWVTCGLLEAARAAGLAVSGMKPVAAGSEIHEGRMINSDAAMIHALSSSSDPYWRINPYCMIEPLSPHIAAKRAGIVIDIRAILACAGQLAAGRDLLLVEGAGGWLAPISEQQTMADIALALGFPVLLVVGLKLGCLNHAQLTARAIRASGCTLAGWIGNLIDPGFAALEENLATLTQRLGMPPLAVIPHEPVRALAAPWQRSALAALLATSRGGAAPDPGTAAGGSA